MALSAGSGRPARRRGRAPRARRGGRRGRWSPLAKRPLKRWMGNMAAPGACHPAVVSARRVDRRPRGGDDADGVGGEPRARGSRAAGRAERSSILPKTAASGVHATWAHPSSRQPSLAARTRALNVSGWYSDQPTSRPLPSGEGSIVIARSSPRRSPPAPATRSLRRPRRSDGPRPPARRRGARLHHRGGEGIAERRDGQRSGRRSPPSIGTPTTSAAWAGRRRRSVGGAVHLSDQPRSRWSTRGASDPAVRGARRRRATRPSTPV